MDESEVRLRVGDARQVVAAIASAIEALDTGLNTLRSNKDNLDSAWFGQSKERFSGLFEDFCNTLNAAKQVSEDARSWLDAEANQVAEAFAN